MRRALTILASAALIGTGTVLVAGSALGETGSTTANVTVASSLTLSGLTPSFTLSGNVGATVSQNGAVTMNVQTNNLLGYTVTVQAASATLAGTGGNTDTIPISALGVRKTGTVPFTSVSNLVPVTVHAQVTPSAPAGDTISNDFQVTIPFVAPDTYSVVLDYTASAT